MAYVRVNNAVELGRCGELIAEAIFEQNGYKCARVNHTGFDLLIFDGNEAYRVEVKSSSFSERKAGTRYKFMTSKGSGSKRLITSDDCDLICYIALDLRRACIKPVGSLQKKRTTLQAAEFDIDEGMQIAKAIRQHIKEK